MTTMNPTPDHDDADPELHTDLTPETFHALTPEQRADFFAEQPSPGPCPCACNNDPPGWCGGCGHAGCGGRRAAHRPG